MKTTLTYNEAEIRALVAEAVRLQTRKAVNPANVRLVVAAADTGLGRPLGSMGAITVTACVDVDLEYSK